MKKTFRLLYKVVEKYDVIFMDVFDTAIKRNVSKPENVFWFVQQRYNRIHKGNVDKFIVKRKGAEIIARKESPNGEVTLEEIYKYIDYSENIKEELFQTEWEIEQEIICSNRDIEAIYDHCIKMGKKIFFISDMYLNAEKIKKLLSVAGYFEYEDVFVSCDWNKTKESGQLFELVIKKNNLDKKKIIHIGDSKRSDLFGAIKAGIKPFYIMTHYENRNYPSKIKSEYIGQDYLDSFVNNNILKKKNRASKVGYECLGPIIWKYCEWIKSKTKQMDRILFLSRDMHLFYKFYGRYFDSEKKSNYIYLSRKSILPAVFATSDKYYLIFAQWCEKDKSISEIFELMNLNSNDYLELLNKYGYSSDEVLDTSDLDSSDAFFWMLYEISEQIKAANQEKAKLILTYLNKYIKPGAKNVICDLGWYGTIQIFLELIYENIYPGTEFEGFYIGVNYPRTRHESNQHGLLYEPENMRYFLNSGGTLLECLCLELCGTVLTYEYALNEIIPVNADCDQEYFSYIKDLHKSALSFAGAFYKCNLWRDIEWDKVNCFGNFLKLLKQPLLAELKDAKHITYEERKSFHLLDSKGTKYYIAHPKHIISDVIDARWKAAFLRELFKININYHDLYYRIRKYM